MVKIRMEMKDKRIMLLDQNLTAAVVIQIKKALPGSEKMFCFHLMHDLRNNTRILAVMISCSTMKN